MTSNAAQAMLRAFEANRAPNYRHVIIYASQQDDYMAALDRACDWAYYAYTDGPYHEPDWEELHSALCGAQAALAYSLDAHQL